MHRIELIANEIGTKERYIFVDEKMGLHWSEGWFNGRQIPPSDILSVQAVTSENVATLGGALAKTAVGAALLGPVGMVLGAVMGSRSVETVALVELTEGRRLVGRMSEKTFSILLGIAFTK